MDHNFFKSLKSFSEQVNECANILIEIENGDLKSEYLKDLEEALVSSISCERKVAIARQAVKEAIDRSLNEVTGEPTVDLFDDLVEESIGELEQDSPFKEVLKKAGSLQDFKELLSKHNAATTNSQEEDLVATQCTVSLIDPISKKKMTDPVRNKKCNHVYDRETITNMITRKSKNGFRCPNMGCQHRDPIKLTDLEDAPDVKRLL